MQRNTFDSLLSTPIQNGLHQATRQPTTPIVWLDIDIDHQRLTTEKCFWSGKQTPYLHTSACDNLAILPSNKPADIFACREHRLKYGRQTFAHSRSRIGSQPPGINKHQHAVVGDHVCVGDGCLPDGKAVWSHLITFLCAHYWHAVR